MPGVQRLMGVCVDKCQLLTYYARHSAFWYFMKTVPFVDTVTVFLLIARALQDIIGRSFTHNDLNNNVCVSKDGHGLVATVIDLGSVKPIGTEHVFPMKVNPSRIPWVAPELLTQTHPSSEVSDVYSLAFMMEKLLRLKRDCVYQHVDATLISWVQTAKSQDPAECPILAGLVVLLERIIEDANLETVHAGCCRDHLQYV